MADPAGTPVAFDLATIAAGLPFAQALPELREALKGGVAVVHAPPGSGKTTLVPPLLAAMADVLGQARAGGAVPGSSSPSRAGSPCGPPPVDWRP